MAVEYTQAPDEVLTLAEELINAHHEDLIDVEIAFLMRTPPATSGGAEVWGKSSKANAKMRALSGKDIEFVIELSADKWDEIDHFQKRALVDHELCHCTMEVDDDGEVHYKIRAHDVEEFDAIARRHGKWNDGLKSFAEQLTLFPQLKAVGE